MPADPLIPELEEPFAWKSLTLNGIFTEIDILFENHEPGLNAPRATILAEDRDAAGIEVGTVLNRQKTGKSYEVKDKRRSGVGLIEIVIGEVKETEVGKGRI